MAARLDTQPEPLAKKYFGRALTNRLQAKQDFIEYKLPALLEEIEKQVEAGRLMMVKHLTPLEAEVLRMPELGFTVKLKYRDRDCRSLYLISWCPKGAKEARQDLERIASMSFVSDMKEVTSDLESRE